MIKRDEIRRIAYNFAKVIQASYMITKGIIVIANSVFACEISLRKKS